MPDSFVSLNSVNFAVDVFVSEKILQVSVPSEYY